MKEYVRELSGAIKLGKVSLRQQCWPDFSFGGAGNAGTRNDRIEIAGLGIWKIILEGELTNGRKEGMVRSTKIYWRKCTGECSLSLIHIYMAGNVRTANIPELMQREASKSTERILREEQT